MILIEVGLQPYNHQRRLQFIPFTLFRVWWPSSSTPKKWIYHSTWLDQPQHLGSIVAFHTLKWLSCTYWSNISDVHGKSTNLSVLDVWFVCFFLVMVINHHLLLYIPRFSWMWHLPDWWELKKGSCAEGKTRWIAIPQMVMLPQHASGYHPHFPIFWQSCRDGIKKTTCNVTLGESFHKPSTNTLR